MSIADDFNDQDPDNFIKDVGAGSLHLRRKVRVGILGATGSVGQHLVSILSKHHWFTITSLSGSERSVGKSYKDAVQWRMSDKIAPEIARLEVKASEPNLDCDLVFSALDGAVAGEIETAFANAGYPVISCAKSHRMDADVPLIVPEVNAQHLDLVKGKKGMIITKPNCSVIGLVLALRPLQLEFGIEAVNVVTMQAISGAGFPGVPSLAIQDNVIPYISGEEERLEMEPAKILGGYNNGQIEPYECKISASCNRVPVSDGHMEVVSVKLKEKASKKQIISAWNEFSPSIQDLNLPSRCTQIIHYFQEDDFPQPKLHRDLENGMALSVGRLRNCPLFDYKFVILSHNMIRGSAGGAVLIAELLVKQGFIFW